MLNHSEHFTVIGCMISSSICTYYLCQVSLRLKEAGKLFQFGLFFIPHLLTYSLFFRIWRLINPSYPEVCDIANIYDFFYIYIYRYYLCQVSLRLKDAGKLSKFGLFFIPQLLIRSFSEFGASLTPLIRKCAI